MNEDNSPPSNEGKKKSLKVRVESPSLNAWVKCFQGEPKIIELVDVIRDSEVNDLIDHDTRDMLKVWKFQRRTVMIPISNGHNFVPTISIR